MRETASWVRIPPPPYYYLSKANNLALRHLGFEVKRPYPAGWAQNRPSRTRQGPEGNPPPPYYYLSKANNLALRHLGFEVRRPYPAGWAQNRSFLAGKLPFLTSLPLKFLNHVYTHAFKILGQIYSKMVNFLVEENR